MLRRFVRYGFAGWSLEILFTGAASVLCGDRSATAKTYLWMFPIYGASGLVLERLGQLLARKRVPTAARALAMVPPIFAVEYLSGDALSRALGRCPWDYSKSGGLHFRGFVRWDYAPFWYAAALGFELLRPRLMASETAPR